MAGVGMRYLCTALLLLTVLPGHTVYAAEAGKTGAPETEAASEDFPDFEDEDFLKEEDWELEDEQWEEAASALFEGIQNAKTIINPVLERTYQEDTGIFTYTLPNQSSFKASVPKGMAAEGPVTFLPMKNAYIVATRNGMMEENSEGGSYTKPGDYKFKMMVFPEGYQGKDMNYYQVSFEFQILPDIVTDITLYSPPEGFYITNVIHEGIEAAPENPKWEFIHRDGDYTVQMVDSETGRIRCEAAFTRDTTAPFMIFTPELETERMKEPVMISISEPGARLQAFYNGTEGILVSNVISAEGRYAFYVSDSAGNTRYYNLNMEGQAKPPERRTVILTIIGAAGVIGYLIYQRRHMRFL